MVFILPGGYVDQHGTVHEEVELRPLTGQEEEFLRGMPPDAPAARVVTELLARCIVRLGSLTAVDRDVTRDMLVGDREYLVMRLFELTCGSALNALVHCPAEDCNAPMDIALSLAAMAGERRPVAARHFDLRLRSAAGREIRLRLPTGGDQEALADIDEARAVSLLLARCSGLDENEIAALPDAARREIEAGMETLAPDTDVEVEATCPQCGRLFSGHVELPTHCLAELAAQSAAVERDVHFLAWHYHWSESEILAMPHPRRRRYIALIEDELNREGEA